MTDWKRAVALLEAAGFRLLPEPGGTSWAPSLWFDRDRGGIKETVVIDAQDKVVYLADAHISDLSTLLSPLTLEKIETAVREALTEPGFFTAYLLRSDAVEVMVNSVMKHIRQQMGGESRD